MLEFSLSEENKVQKQAEKQTKRYIFVPSYKHREKK